MVRMYVRHRVGDFDSWKQAYDAFDTTRRRLGVRGDAVFHGAEDRNDVTVWNDFDDMATAQAFLESDELRSAMQAAGVVGEPQVWFVSREL